MSDVTVLPYVVYSLDDITQTSSLNDLHQSRVVSCEIGMLACALSVVPVWTDLSVIYEKPHYVGYLVFHALCEGWEDFTSTGSKGHFFFHADPTLYENDNYIRESFLSLLEQHHFTIPAAVQQGLF